MSVIVLVMVGAIAGIVARMTVKHSLVLAAVLVAASSSPSSAADAPDAWINRLTALTLARTTDGVRSVVGDLTVKAQ